MLRKTVLTLAASAALGVAALAPTSAGATWYGHGYHHGYHYAPAWYGYHYYAPWLVYGPHYVHPGWKFGWKYRKHYW